MTANIIFSLSSATGRLYDNYQGLLDQVNYSWGMQSQSWMGILKIEMPAGNYLADKSTEK